MKQLSIGILCVAFFLLSGCPRHAPVLPQTAEQTLVPLYTEVLPTMPKYIGFSKKGGTFIVAGIADFIYLYDVATFKKHTEIKKETQKENKFPDYSFHIRGVGYIDDNTWYTAAYTSYATTMENLNRNKLSRNAVIHIRQIEPPQELHKYDVVGFSEPVLANATHIAYEGTLLNWHDGNTYEVALAHPGKFGYGLTPDSLVVSGSLRGKCLPVSRPGQTKRICLECRR